MPNEFDILNRFQNLQSSTAQKAIDKANNKQKITDRLLMQKSLLAQSTNGDNVSYEDGEVEIVNNILTAPREIVDRYGIRQKIISKNGDEDISITAHRQLDDNCTPEETITVKCLGDITQKVGYGVHVAMPFLIGYEDCFMYAKSIKRDWLNMDIFTDEMVLTPSRVMDEHEWEDVTADNEEDEDDEGGSGSKADQIIEYAKTFLGNPYVWGGTGQVVTQSTIDSFRGTDHDMTVNPNWKSFIGKPGYDCSGFTQAVYKHFDIEITRTTTSNQINQGKSVPTGDKSQWKICDLIFPSTCHVQMYIGDGKVIEAPQSGDVISINECRSKVPVAVRRILSDDDYVVHESASNSSSKNSSFGSSGIPSEYLPTVQKTVDANIPTFLNNMSKFGFKEHIKMQSSQAGIDPYLVAGLICIESEGNPCCGSTYKGLMQVQGGSIDPKTNIIQGIAMLKQKKSAVNTEQWHVVLSAFNSGEGTVLGAKKSALLDLNSCTIKQLGDALYNYVKTHNPGWSPDEKKYYASKVILAMNTLKQRKALS